MGDGDGDPYLSGGGGGGGGDSEDDDEREDDSRQSGMHEYDDSQSSEESPTEETQDGSTTDSGGTPTPIPTGSGDGSGVDSVEVPENVDVGGDSPEEPEDDDETGEPERPPERDLPEQNHLEREPPELDPEESEDPKEPENPEQDETEDEEDDEGDDEDEEDQQLKVVQHSDPWDNMGWGLYPLMLKLEEEYGHTVDLHYSLVSIRGFESPEEMTEAWKHDGLRHQMPVNTDVWEENPPESTALANRAYLASLRQGERKSKRYLRRLRVAAIVEGRNIEDKETLFKLAVEVGLDPETLEEVWDDVDVQEKHRDPNPPRTVFHVDGETVTHSGYLHYNDIIDIFDQVDLERQDPQPLLGFINEYGPVTMTEVQEVYDEYGSAQIRTLLEDKTNIEPITIGDTTFWTILG